jgi:Hexokinase
VHEVAPLEQADSLLGQHGGPVGPVMGAQVCLSVCPQSQHDGPVGPVTGAQVCLSVCLPPEWADFASPTLPVLAEDEEVDRTSVIRGQHRFEKLTSGLYMGEVVRLILKRCKKVEKCSPSATIDLHVYLTDLVSHWLNLLAVCLRTFCASVHWSICPCGCPPV